MLELFRYAKLAALRMWQSKIKEILGSVRNGSVEFLFLKIFISRTGDCFGRELIDLLKLVSKDILKTIIQLQLLAIGPKAYVVNAGWYKNSFEAYKMNLRDILVGVFRNSRMNTDWGSKEIISKCGERENRDRTDVS